MFIGDIVIERMNLFGYTQQMLAENTMFDIKFVEDIISNKIPVENLDEFDLEVLSNALFCDIDYFVDQKTRQKDVVFCSKNRGTDTTKSNLAKAKIQNYMKDLISIKEALC